jgi:hypothetical protein
VVLDPVPVVIIPSGLRVNVHVPVLGKPFSTTLLVATAQLGGVIVPTEGVLGTDCAALITTVEDARDVQPVELFTVNV